MPGILDIATLREHISTSLSDGALQNIIDANDEILIARVGDVGEVETLKFIPEYETIILLGRVPETITSVIEEYGSTAPVELDDTDYWNYRGTLRRRDDGTNPATYWTGPVQILWTPTDDTNIRLMALVELAKLDINHKPGLSAFRVGERSETYASGSQEPTYEEKREAILSRLENALFPPVFV